MKVYEDMTYPQKVKFIQNKILECKNQLALMKAYPVPEIDDVQKIQDELENFINEARKLELQMGNKGKLFYKIWE